MNELQVQVERAVDFARLVEEARVARSRDTNDRTIWDGDGLPVLCRELAGSLGRCSRVATVDIIPKSEHPGAVRCDFCAGFYADKDDHVRLEERRDLLVVVLDAGHDIR